MTELMTESFAQMFEESLASQRIRPGQILTGRVIEVTVPTSSW
jgi:small subunit ribosomal protein S1